MLVNLITILVWLLLLTFWILITNSRREEKKLAEFEAEIFGDD